MLLECSALNTEPIVTPHYGDLFCQNKEKVMEIAMILLDTSRCTGRGPPVLSQLMIQILLSTMLVIVIILKTWIKIYIYENHDIAIAMFPSRADPVLPWLGLFKYLNQCHCPGWRYLNIYISVTALTTNERAG